MPKIIVIDDDAHLLKTISLFLISEGYSVIECNSAIKGYLEFKSQCPDLVITDLNMPMTSGVDYIYKVRDFDKLTPIVAMSANTDLLQTLADKKNELNLSVITKPFQLPDLKILVEQILAEPQGTQMQLANLESRISQSKQRYLACKMSSDKDGMIASLYLIYRILVCIQLTKLGYNLSYLYSNEGFDISLPAGKSETDLGLFPNWHYYQKLKGEWIRALTQTDSLVDVTAELEVMFAHADPLIS